MPILYTHTHNGDDGDDDDGNKTDIQIKIDCIEEDDDVGERGINIVALNSYSIQLLTMLPTYSHCFNHHHHHHNHVLKNTKL